MRSHAALTRRPRPRRPRRDGAAAAPPPRRRRRGDAGGAVTLFVVLLVPVLVLAAAAAAAVPQRMAAEASMREAARDIADLAHLQGASQDPAAGLTLDLSCDPAATGADSSEARVRAAMCATMRGLGASGVSVESARGYYTNVLHAGIDSNSGGAAPAPLLCDVDAGSVNAEAVYAAIVADWSEASWAAAQVWPQGLRIGAEALAVRNRTDPGPASGNEACRPARRAVNDGSVDASIPGDPAVRHPLRGG